MAPGLRFVVAGRGVPRRRSTRPSSRSSGTDPYLGEHPVRPADGQPEGLRAQPGAEDRSPVGVAGELYLGGVGLGRGYFGRPAQTAERFLRRSVRAGPAGGCIGRATSPGCRPDGALELIGRADYQVKLRGLRVECGEIEATLRRTRRSARRSSRPREFAGDKRLVAYVRPSRQNAHPVLPPAGAGEVGAAQRLAAQANSPNGLALVYANRNEAEFGYREIFEDDGYLRHGVRLRDGDRVFDVRANIGMFATAHGPAECPSVEIYAFEPIPPIFELLELNTAIHGLNVRLFNCGLASGPRVESLTYYPHLSLISGPVRRPGGRPSNRPILPSQR